MKYYVTLIGICLFLIACSGFEIEKQVVGNYYLIKSEGITDLSYKLKNGTYVGKIPSTLIEYGFDENYIVGKTIDSNIISYYIVDRKRDFDFAIEKNFRIGPISENEYRNEWEKKLKIKFQKAEE